MRSAYPRETQEMVFAGSDDSGRQMVNILAAVITDGLSAVEAACAEAIAPGVHSADVVLNILARQRNPDPPPAIMTPAALLRHAPVADWARYDNLMRLHLPFPSPQAEGLRPRKGTIKRDHRQIQVASRDGKAQPLPKNELRTK